MNDKPLITCVIPCYNHEKWVSQAINSIIKQNYPNKRLIIINDASTDNSWNEILKNINNKKIINQEKPVIYHGDIQGVSILAVNFEENIGRSAARNYGIRAGIQDTDLFGFLDSDDYYEQGKLEKSVNTWLINPESIGVVYSDYTTLNIHDGSTQRQWKEPFNLNRLYEECIVNNDSLISKQAILNCGDYDQELEVCEDYDLWFRISKKYLIYHIPESLITVRVGKHSSTDTVSKSTWEKCYKRVMEKNASKNLLRS